MTPAKSKIRVKKAGERPIEGSTVTAAFHMLDNHRSFSHGAFAHDPDPVINADALFEIYKFENNIRKKREEAKKRAEETRSAWSPFRENLNSLVKMFENTAKGMSLKDIKAITLEITLDEAHLHSAPKAIDIRADFLSKYDSLFSNLMDTMRTYGSLHDVDKLFGPRVGFGIGAGLGIGNNRHYYVNGTRKYLYSSYDERCSVGYMPYLGADATESLWNATKTIKSYVATHPALFDTPLSHDMIKDFLEKLEKTEKPTQESVDARYESEFAERNRLRTVPVRRNTSDQLEAAWKVQQIEIRDLEKDGTIKHSIHDEDTLGDFDSWVDNRPDSVQYLMMGDTNHSNETLRTWINEGSYMAALKKNGYDDLVVETSARAEKPVQDYINGKIGLTDLRGQLKELQIAPVGLLKLARAAKQAGIMLHMFDEQVHERRNTKDEAFWTERRDHDGMMAKKIKARFGDKKLAIIYGAAHFQYEGWMQDKLGKEKCAVVNVHPDLQEYKHFHRWNVAQPAPYALILDEQQVVASQAKYGRNMPANKDTVTGSIRRLEQKKEIELFEGKVQDHTASGEKSYITPAEVVDLAKLTWARTQRSGSHWHFNI